MSEPPHVRIADSASEVSLTALRRQYPDSRDYWDGNWIRVDVAAKSTGFQAHLEEWLHLGEVAAFRRDLLGMSADLKGSALLETMEDFLRLEVKIDALGRLHWSVALTYRTGRDPKSCLQFGFENDQSYLPEIAAGLDAILKDFPLVSPR